ncbi:uncharacterized protein LOC122058193 isoform X2 [Macadamia integrifolia]|uniref:uncharacterized protein LOC122058193 isoform X2 n=1 Tax=Macadamia integrifolia TaxID=60698 RepID=UPI001C533CD8|nr:uncharacterized protein LOC122058193 isoform X2 [Macadamia integrifolia]
MVELCLMAYSTSPSGLFHKEQGLCRVQKEFQPFMPIPGTRQQMISSSCFHIRPLQLEDPWKSTARLSEQIKLDSTIKRPELVDIQETRPDLVLLSSGIAEQCRRHENILHFLMSQSSEKVRDVLDISLVSDLGLQMLAIDTHPQPYASPDDGFRLYEVEGDDAQLPFIYPNGDSAQKPLLDFVGDLARGSKVTVQPDGRVLLAGTVVEMKDLLSVVAEFYLSKNTTKCRRQHMLVPHFTRVDRTDAPSIHGNIQELDTLTIAPLKSPEKNKQKSSPRKRHNKKSGRGRDLYRKNYLHACEILLTLILEKRRGKNVILSLKKSGPELAELLNQFSAGIAGTGLAVIFSVVCKVVGGRATFCASKLLNSGIGFGLVWLSWSVNRLRDTIIHISKNSSKLGSKEDQMMRRVDRSMNEIFFRAATIMAVTVLRFA